ncbi:MAG: SAM hydroxide adenosyltransferase, partial [Acidimicrobiia bacterium]
YGDVEDGEAVVHIDSHGQIALGVRGGRADEDFGIGVGDSVVIRRPGVGDRIEITSVSHT